MNETIKLLVIADDFTGALDTGIQFAEQGLEVSVLLKLEEEPAKGQVLVYNGETRHKTPEEAYEITKEILRWAKKQAITHLYKKTDSALRGNIGSELKAILEEFDSPYGIFVPAYPDLNRKTIEGVQWIEGKPAAESVFAADPFNPVKHSKVEEILKETAEHLPVFYEGEADVKRFWEKKADLQGICIRDGQTNEDLLREADAAWKEGTRLFVGCAGFAKALAGKLCPLKKQERLLLSRRPFLAVCGSMNPVTRKQVQKAREAGMKVRSIPGNDLLQETFYQDPSFAHRVTELAEICRDQGALIIDTLGNEFGRREEVSAGERIAEGLGKLVYSIIGKGIRPVLFCTGGDTFLAAIRYFDPSHLAPWKEVDPGVVLSSFNWQGEVIYVISKAGGFGEEDLLISLREQLM